MDAGDTRGYAYPKRRTSSISLLLPFRLGRQLSKDAAVGTTVDELCVWHEPLDPQQIWQFYVQGGTVSSGWFYVILEDDNTHTLN